MLTEKEEMLRKLALRGLILTDYDWSDVQYGVIENLTFTYRTRDGEEGILELGNIDVDLGMDWGDPVVDTMGGLYILEPDGIDDNFDDFLDDDPNIKRSDIPDIETEYPSDQFYTDLMKYCDEDD